MNKPNRSQSGKALHSSRETPTVIHTKIIDDVFTDAVDMVKPRFEVDVDAYVDRLKEANPEILKLLSGAETLEAARDQLYTYLEAAEREIFKIQNDFHILEKATVRESIRVFKSIIGPINEHRTGFSALQVLWKLARENDADTRNGISAGFLLEFINLYRGVAGRSNIYFESREAKKGIPDFLRLEGRKAAEARTIMLDDMGVSVKKYFKKYPSGLDPDLIEWREENRHRILDYFGGAESDWKDYRWQLKHVIKDAKPLLDLIELTSEQQDAIRKASSNAIPFGITPYYLSLMDRTLSIGFDAAIRAQVIPPPDYVNQMAEHRTDRSLIFDFMGEHDTSPVDLVTRRYPMIAIIKPFNTCAQICVYCQRNWEIDEVMDPKAMADKHSLAQAIQFLADHPSIGDVLVTGGDPCIMRDESFRRLIQSIADIPHVIRIRIGTRTPVVLPMRWSEKFLDILSSFHEPGHREVAVITHFEHSSEVTPESMEAVQKIRKRGIGVYNQEVFTIYNSRRFESAKLRRDLRLIGVDPYYTFNMKGKDETRRYMVPIARILQERKEEARLLPGLDRTDEPVFNVPKLGKNHLRAWQDHRVVMILANGSRVYEFHPWEKNIKPLPPYNYVDVPIYDYLEELAARGENIRDYRTIWYYY
ncbi:MAG TPA: KamA family radical SAM protein [Thermoanaerobaculia bacterium]|nr:KamA family radical SAM protein [Thermoanaerobaculia bacterium]HUM31072.1 KamA family radical SAM protein [Thermoanaerobaculia bacterium]HXK69416.1 KamA family radical SAM protein [Thermoanaerobaculia bacterium]